jgi:ATP/ADP translocase
MVVAFGAVVVFTWLSRRFQRQWLMHIFGAFFLVCFAAFSLVMTRPTDTGAWSFYLLGDLFSTLMVTTFFAFLNDSVSSDEAKRLYGIVGFGGVVGGVVGSTFVGVWIPVLWVGSLLNTSDNAFSYSINQSAKEVLYVPTTREQKYRAKAFIDMFVQRFAKSVAVVVSLVVSTLFAEFESVRWLAIINASVVIMWLIAARYAGRAFHTKADRTDGRTG